MPLCTFPNKAAAPKERTKANANYIAQDGLASTVYGTAGSAGNTDSHPGIPDGQDKKGGGAIIGEVTTSDVISKAAFDATKTIIDTERARRGRGAGTYSSVTTSTAIDNSHFNELRTAIQVSSDGSDEAYMGARADTTSATGQADPEIITYPAAPAQSNFPSQTGGSLITAANINKLVKDLNDSNSACTCNCNYCSCNCNYCTCNCNYSCTCNCNYSDVTTKENIVYM